MLSVYPSFVLICLVFIIVIVLTTMFVLVCRSTHDKTRNHENPPPYPYKTTPIRLPDLEGTPLPGIQRQIQRCSYKQLLQSPNLSFYQKQELFEKHLIPPFLQDSSITKNRCDQDCHDMFLQQLYESFMIQFALEDESLTFSILSIYHKVFFAIEKKMESYAPGKFQQLVDEWSTSTVHHYFPVAQQNRDWKTSPVVLLKTLAGITHDPTSVLLAGNFLKLLSSHLHNPNDPTHLPLPYLHLRDYSFNHLLKRIRGYRTNQAQRKKEETQSGIVNLDFPSLELSHPYYSLHPWLHPGRSKCDVTYLQGNYQHEAYERSIPLECGVSGSTNFWLWTIAWSQVELTKEETALFVFSAFLTLGADGGHSLNEVMSTATITSMFWNFYICYSKHQTWTPIFTSSFARHLATITQCINPIGSGPFLTLSDTEYRDLIDSLFHSSCFEFPYDSTVCPFFFQPDTTKLTPQEMIRRQQLESLFTYNRRQYLFGDYTTFLNQLPLDSIRKRSLSHVIQYIHTYC